MKTLPFASKQLPIMIAILAVIVACVLLISKQIRLKSITTFEQCTQAGYPVMESYPMRCSTPDGREFVQR